MDNKLNSSNNLSRSLGETLAKSDLTNVSAEFLESILDDNLLDIAVLKDIPIIGSIVGIGKTVNTIQDYLFTKKMLSFLAELSLVKANKRAKVVSEIDSNPRYNQKVGSKLLYIIDSAQDHVTSGLVGKLFATFIEGKLTYQEFCKASLIINRIDYYDLQEFLEIPETEFGQRGSQGVGLEDIDNYFVNAGLCSMETDPVDVEDETDWKVGRKYSVTGGETLVYLTIIGRKIHELLSEN